MIPATAPPPASRGETAVKITTPNATDEGSATSIAASAPHASASKNGIDALSMSRPIPEA